MKKMEKILQSKVSFPLHIPLKVTDSKHFRCLDFTRSLISPCDESEEQFNEVTHFLDGSAIYGSTQARAKSYELLFQTILFSMWVFFIKAQMNLLREHVGGRIRVLDDGLMPLEVDVCRKPGNDKIIC